MDFIVTILYLWLTLFLKCGALKGGDEVKNNEFPYIVSLQNSINHTHFCAGVIISQEWILSAGHCFNNRREEQVVVKAGTMFLDQGTSHRVDKIIVHPNFKQRESQVIANDIALLRLKTPFQFNKNIRAVDLGRIRDESGIWVLTVGWGTSVDDKEAKLFDILHKLCLQNMDSENCRKLDIKAKLSNSLQKLCLQNMDSENCRKLHSKVGNVVDTEICVFGGLGKSPCDGDSGGPLINWATKRLVGIFSGYQTCQGDFPALYVRISVYVDWLRSVTGLELPLN